MTPCTVYLGSTAVFYVFPLFLFGKYLQETVGIVKVFWLFFKKKYMFFYWF